MKTIIIKESQLQLIKESKQKMAGTFKRNNDLMAYEDFIRYQSENEDELMEYAMLWPQDTGIVNLYCFADDGYAYKRHHHPIWFFICNGYGKHVHNYLPICVTDSPYIVLDKYPLNISKTDLEKVFCFIKLNKQILIDIAKQKITNSEGHNLLKPVIESNNKLGRIITEMAILTPIDTGLPVNIWVDENELNIKGGHGPRIKFAASQGEKNSHNYATMTISDNPQILNLPPKCNLSGKQLQLLKDFVIKYQYNLNSLSKQQMTRDEF
jgi:hypothetical protein